ncbi:unnamed protein product [Leptidea sinapis]|uniref:Band 7 domain-containing protein n=1 Tax=Leptidea sinapis TaxID=189913 RepID=A0A5E4Q869_9NEOP|nr:unnamed protein product [Leptidea sinapis]
MRDLAQLLSDREAISHMMQANLDEATDPWGVEVERVEIKDVRLPVQLQRAMAAEAEADREARAKIIAAEGEIKASKALREASLVMIDNPMALQLRYLQSLNTISAEKNSTIIFPFPSDSPAGPGIIWLVPCTDSVEFIDLRTQSFNLPPQEILTKDSVTVTVDAVVYFHVTNPLKSLLNVQSHKRATELLSVAILRNYLGQYTLAELLSSRVAISDNVKLMIDKGTIEWGVQVQRVEIKNVLLPFELQKAMAAEAEGTRIAKAKIIEAEGEIKTAENLKEASQVIMENPKAMLLRYLQTLNSIASQQTTSILFPFPMDLPSSH